MPETFSQFFFREQHRFDAVLFDIDGTLSSAGKALPGAEELLLHLKNGGVPYLLLTNDSSHSRREKSQILQRAGLPVTEDEIISSGDALRGYVSSGAYNGGLFFKCGLVGDPCFAAAAGIEVTTDPGRIIECCGCVIGEGEFNWQPAMEGVFNMLLEHPEYPCVVPNPDSYWPYVSGAGFGFGAGAIARFITGVLAEAGREVKPVFLGKPHRPIYDFAFQELRRSFGMEVRPERLLMVGDSLASDIRGGNLNGMVSALVLTGITGAAMAEQAEAEFRPQLIFSGL